MRLGNTGVIWLWLGKPHDGDGASFEGEAMKALLKHQNLLKGGIFLGVGGVVAIGLWVFLDDPVSEKTSQGRSSPAEASKIDTAAPLSPQEVFHRKIEMQNDLLQKQIEAQGKILEELMKKQGDQPLKVDEDLALKIQDLERRLSEKTEVLPSTGSPVLNLLDEKDPSQQGIQRVKVPLAPQQWVKTGRTVDTTLPAGSFVKALVLGGVAASTSVTAAQNPKPVLLNLIDHGSLPRGFFSDLKDCRLTAASHGDLSSERVSIRLEKLSCVERATGEIIETPVSGYVVGEDGFEGVKGAMADRTGPLLRNSFVAGFFGGLSSAIGQHAMQNPLLSTPLGIQQQPTAASQLLQHGAGKGLNGALDKFADFYIKRAEQMQPVLYVRAGRRVDVVFTEGVSLGDTLIRKALSQSKEGARLKEARKLSTPRAQGVVQERAQAAISSAAPHNEPQNLNPSRGEEPSW